MPPPQTEVLITVAGMETARHIFAPGEYVLGRDADCHIPIEAGLVSRRHARLTLNFDNALIEDLGSDGGTHINGKPIPKGGRTRLWPNQKIQVGAATIELRRLKADSDPDRTLAPTQEVVKRVLPEAFLREKKYDIGGVVAQGGMGAILDAKEATIERTVAMKVMLDSNAPDDLLRFLNEAKITGQLEHPNIVPVHELSVDENGQPFYTMKFVKGITLRKVLELLTKGEAGTMKKFPLPVLLTIFQKVCDALAFAHSRGVIHRDLKPENIMVGDYGEVLLMDWGLAKRLRNTERGEGKDGSAPPEEDIRTIRHSVAEEMPATAVFDPAALASTMAGAIMGTPQYMAPEQARGEIETLDQRADIYALGAILFHVLFLRPSVSGSDSMQIVGKVGRGEIEWIAPQLKIQNSKLRIVPDSLLAVCRKALALDPGARYPHVEELQADILAYQTGFATSAENASAWKQFTLLVKRHKALSASAALIAVLSVAFTMRVLHEKNIAISERNRAEENERRAESERKTAAKERDRAEDALASLKNTAPTFAAQARGLVEQGNLEDALEKIGYAVSLDKGNADYLLQQANLLQATQQLTEAAESYRAVLALRADAAAKLNLELCEKLLLDNAGSEELTRESQESLVNAMMKQGRAVEAAELSSMLGQGSGAALAAIKARLKPLIAIIGPGGGVSRRPNGTFRLSLLDKPVVKLPPLDGLPITEVNISGTKISDLTPLKGLRLISLQINSTPVTDLSPIAGMPLEVLRAGSNKIKYLTPLKGMPLKELSMTSNPYVFDLSPLRGMALKTLHLSGTAVVDLRPLAGMPIEALKITDTSVNDLSPLASMPLEMLFAENSKITDLSPLRGCPLRGLYLTKTPVSDLSPLAGLPIGALHISGTKVTDIAVLRTLPRLMVLRVQCPVKDLRPLADCKAMKQLDIPKVTSDISFLRALPNLERLTDKHRVALGIDRDTPPAEQFWQKYDEQQAAGEAREEDLAQVRAALPALGMAKGNATIVKSWGVRVSLLDLPVADIAGLRPLPIDALGLSGTKVTDLAPLRGMELKELSFPKTAVKDVSPLLDMPILEAATVTQGVTNLEFLRHHPTLQWLGWEGDHDTSTNRPKLTTAEFWARYDAQQAGEKK